MEPVVAQSLFESINLLRNACAVLRTSCVEGITANPEVCLAYVTNSIGIITYLNDYIGHAAGDAIGKEAARTGRGVRELVLEQGLMDPVLLDRVLSVENLMQPQDVTALTDPEAAR